MRVNKYFVALVAMALAATLFICVAVTAFGAGSEVTVTLSAIGSEVVEELPPELGDGDTLVVICDTDDGAFVVTDSAPALSAIKFVVGGVTVKTDLSLATTVFKDGADVTGFGIGVEYEADPSLPSNANKLFGEYAGYVVGVGAASFDANEVEINTGKVVEFTVEADMGGLNVVVYDEDYNTVPSHFEDGKVTFEGKLGEGYAIAPEMVAVVDGKGYPTLEEAISVAEGSLDNPVAIIGEGNYLLDTTSQVVVGIAGDAVVSVADGIFSYDTEVEFEDETYTAYALFEKDYLIGSIVDKINESSGGYGYSAVYSGGDIEFFASSQNASDILDIVTAEKLYEIVGAAAPLAVVCDTVEFDGYPVFNGSFDPEAAKDFAATKMMTLEEASQLTDKTVFEFVLTLTSGATVETFNVDFTLDITDQQFNKMKDYAESASRYVTIENKGGVLTAYIDATVLYNTIVEKSDKLQSYTVGELRERLNTMTVGEAADRVEEEIEKRNLTGKLETAADVFVKVVDKVEASKYAGNLDLTIAVLDKDEDGIYSAKKDISYNIDGVVAKAEDLIYKQYPQLEGMFDIGTMIGVSDISLSFDITVEVWEKFTVSFLGELGDLLYEVEVVEGDIPEYSGELPTKATDAEYVYQFAGWTVDGVEIFAGELPEVTEDVSYTVYFEATPIEGIDPELKFFGASVIFQGRMKVKFLVEKTTLEGYEYYYVNYNYKGEAYDIEGSENGDYIQFYVEDIAAKDLGEIISVQLIAFKQVNEVTVTAKSEVKEYSVKQYCYNRLAEPEATDAEKTFIVDFLNYGTAAQNYFDHNTGALVNADLTEEQKGYATSTEPSIESHFVHDVTGSETVSFFGASLLYYDNIAIKFIMDFRGYAGDVSDVTFVIEYQSETIEVAGAELVANGDYYTYAFEALSIRDLRDTITVKVVDETGNVSGTLTYSAETYAYNMKDDENAELVTLVKSLMKYTDSADVYFG